jgi:hypothetical protein
MVHDKENAWSNYVRGVIHILQVRAGGGSGARTPWSVSDTL